ncbi:hypothetical protein [Streptosporangium sp. NPDC049376]|uniref:hypothetical protein n=1 Tax=Streptosporangium sp. NPDC049376 TaxID=3366192 RepID=UPI0037A317D7
MTAPTALPTARTAGRPQLRLNIQEAEFNRLFQAWFRCLRNHGAPFNRVPGAKRIHPATYPSLYPKAMKACEGRQPIHLS